jgi:hypothetical protein
MGNFRSQQYNVTPLDVAQSYELFGGEFLVLKNIEFKFKGHGHYTLIGLFELDDETIEKRVTITDMNLVDAWKSGMRDLYEDGEDGFNNWDEVVETVLCKFDIF